EEVVVKFVSQWKENSQLTEIIDEIEGSRIRKEHRDFFRNFCDSLQLIDDEKASVEKFAYGWTQLGDEHWDQALSALDALRRQWFARKLAEQALEDKFLRAKDTFNAALKEYKEIHDDIKGGKHNKWGLDATKHLLFTNSYQAKEGEDRNQAEARLQQSSPLGSEPINDSRSKLFTAALTLNEALIERAAKEFNSNTFKDLASLIDGKLETKELKPHHKKLWAVLFLFFPAVSTSLASVENQFRLMQQPEGFGIAMFDESGQAVNYHVAGLLQRCRQAIFVGDPIQLEPVVTTPEKIDLAIARDFLDVSDNDGKREWGDDYLIAESSAQSIADKACNYYAQIGDRPVGIPLLVHRRCTEPMFSIANNIAYDDKMVLASPPFKWNALQSGWVHISEQADNINGSGYFNYTEAKAAIELVRHLCEKQPSMVEGGVYIITPFSKMRSTIAKQWDDALKDSNNHEWMKKAFGSAKQDTDLKEFSKENIGTVHTFQGKEASTVLLCTAASSVRQNTGGIQWVNSKPNLINVAVTRAKHHLFIIGNMEDWESGVITGALQRDNMRCYANLDELKQSPANSFEEHVPSPRPDIGSSLKYNLMGA
ncbi:DEAD/DEAH box helicase, partial [Vibrio sp. 10N.261.49.A3]